MMEVPSCGVQVIYLFTSNDVIARSCPRDGVRFLEDDLAGAVGVYRHGNQPGGGGTGMLFFCLLRNDGGRVDDVGVYYLNLFYFFVCVSVCVFLLGVLHMHDVTASDPPQPFEGESNPEQTL